MFTTKMEKWFFGNQYRDKLHVRCTFCFIRYSYVKIGQVLQFCKERNSIDTKYRFAIFRKSIFYFYFLFLKLRFRILVK